MGELLEHQRVVLRQAAAVAATPLAVHVILDAQRQGTRPVLVQVNLLGRREKAHGAWRDSTAAVAAF